MPSKSKIAFIGAGRMAEAIVSGIIRAGLFRKADIFASDRDEKRLKYFADSYGIRTFTENKEAVTIADIIVLSVKPQAMLQVLEDIRNYARTQQLYISIAAGVPIGSIESRLPGCSVVRTMPNNPCLIGEGMTVLSRGKNAGEADLNTAKKIFSALGKTMVLEEKMLDAATGLSGSGPAFVYRFIDALAEGGAKSGLPREAAYELAQQTVLGASRTVIETKKTPSQLCDMVTSPGGTTIEGLKVLDEAKFADIVADTVIAAARRAAEITNDKL